MFFFKKKKKPEEEEQIAVTSGDDSYEDPEVPVAAAPEKSESSFGDASMGKLSADVEKLKAQFGTFYELQKASNERFSNINEQIGELRSMLIERDKDSQRLEAKSNQAIDLVKTVQPDKFMVDIRKIDGKVEALKANIESNENIVKNAINELKDMRNKMTVFKGMEQIISMEEEAKTELIEIKKVQAIVERHADKVETIFSEMQKKFSDFIKVADMVKDLDKSFKDIASDFDSIKVKIADFGTKKEIENLIAKFDDFEKYVGNIVTLINKKFEKLNSDFSIEFKKKFEDSDKLLKGFEILAMKTPDLDKYFNLLDEEAKKAIAKEKKSGNDEKVKELGADEKVEVPPEETVATKVAGAVSGVKEKVASTIQGK